MFMEVAIIAGVVFLGSVLIYALLFLFFRNNLTTKLWLRLIPGIFGLCLTCFILGKFGAYNVAALAVCFAVGVTLMLSNFIIVTSGLIRPINEIIKGLNEASDKVAFTSNQISSSGQTLSESASEQAASIEETSSSMEEMSSMTEQNANNAKQADSLVKEAHHVVNQANGSLSRLTMSMEEISKASNETSKIIKTIDEIAFQTNLLALNAAIEAARAGEVGAGFAVVADEVRNLAMRAAEAAKNTSEMIEGTVKKIGEGSDLVTATNEAFGKVTESSLKVGELVSEIALASDEQAQGVRQINTAVSEMDRVVQQNAANAEEFTSASGELNAQAEQVKMMVSELVAMVGKGRSEYKARSEDLVEVFVTRPTHQELLPPSNSPDKKKESAVKEREISPEQVIPLDDGFKD